MVRPREPFGAATSISLKNSFTRVEERWDDVMMSTLFVPCVGAPDLGQTILEKVVG
jgi:hypothetical protein